LKYQEMTGFLIPAFFRRVEKSSGIYPGLSQSNRSSPFLPPDLHNGNKSAIFTYSAKSAGGDHEPD